MKRGEVQHIPERKLGLQLYASGMLLKSREAIENLQAAFEREIIDFCKKTKQQANSKNFSIH